MNKPFSCQYTSSFLPHVFNSADTKDKVNLSHFSLQLSSNHLCLSCFLLLFSSERKKEKKENKKDQDGKASNRKNRTHEWMELMTRYFGVFSHVQSSLWYWENRSKNIFLHLYQIPGIILKCQGEKSKRKRRKKFRKLLVLWFVMWPWNFVIVPGLSPGHIPVSLS